MARVVVVGCGAMGGVYSSFLAGGGHEVVVIEPSPAIFEAVTQNGLTVVEPDGEERHTAIDIRTDPASVTEQPDFLLFFVKSVHNAQAAKDTAHLIGPSTVVATVQNGMGHGEVFSTIVPMERLIVGLTYQGANTLAPGRIEHYRPGHTDVGPFLPGGNVSWAESFAVLLNGSGLQATVVPEVRTAIWGKVLINSAYNPIAALTGLSMAQLLTGTPAGDLAVAMLRESAAVAVADGASVDAEHTLAIVADDQARMVAGTLPAGRPSMLLDVENKRRTEIDSINGAVIARAESLGVPAPLNGALFALVKGLEESWQQ